MLDRCKPTSLYEKNWMLKVCLFTTLTFIGHSVQPYSGRTLPQLGLRGQFNTPATQRDPIAAPKQLEIRPKQQFFFPA